MDSSVVLYAKDRQVGMALAGGFKIREEADGSLSPYLEMSPEEAVAVMQAMHKILVAVTENE